MTFSSNYKTITLAGLLLTLDSAERVRRRVAAAICLHCRAKLLNSVLIALNQRANQHRRTNARARVVSRFANRSAFVDNAVP